MLDALDVPLDTALAALAEFQPLAGRGQIAPVAAPGGAFTLIDESYNANPLSMAAGFRSLGARPVAAGGRRVVVLTDMLELGDQSRALHDGLAEPIEAAGLDLVHAAGPEMKRLYDALPASRRGLWRETAAELAAEAAMLAGPGRHRHGQGLERVEGLAGRRRPGRTEHRPRTGHPRCSICSTSTTPTSRRTIRC